MNGEESRGTFKLMRLRKWIALMAAVLTVWALTTSVWATQLDIEAGYTEVNETVYAVTAVNIRSGPGTNYSRLGLLEAGASIQRIAIGSDGWSKVMYNGQAAYIFSQYLTTSKPDGYTDHLDDGELKRQIAIANGLNRMDYTAESWKKLSAVLEDAQLALNGNNQIKADAATENLKNAIAALVRMDYSDLEAALDAAEDLVESKTQYGLWVKVLDAVDAGRELLASGDQAAVDVAAAQINDLLTQLKAAIEAEKTPDVVVKEVLVEVLPQSGYCNISDHGVWLVMFFVSLVVNVTLVAVIAVYTHRKKLNQRDDTPLVDYDIYDDTL